MSSDRIGSLLAEAVAQGVAAGLSAAVTLSDGGARTFTAGVRGAADPAPMDPSTMFWIASCTKAITSAAALELVAQGRLDLDEPASRRLAPLAEAKVLCGFDDKGAPILRPAQKPVTLRALLTHTSGLAYDFNHADTGRYLQHCGLTLGAAGGLGLPLVFEPGEDWCYGVGIDVAGLLIEHATGRPLGEALADMIFRPLGMEDTTFDPTPEQNARRAGLHARLPDGGLAPIDPIPPMPAELRGGGGLFSTPSDYLKFLRAILDNGGGVLSPATVAHLSTSQTGALPVGEIRSVMPQLSSDYRPMPGLAKGFTFGFLQNLDPLPGGRAAGSLAWAGLANCYYWADPKNGVAGALFAQSLPFADPRVLGVFDAFERAVYAS
jgi:CubicO group peptidase (beta-lactamase class C family)